MPTLAELIQDARGDESYESVASRIGVGRGVIHKWATGRNQFLPEPELINPLAKYLGITPAAVITAAAEGLGYDMHDDDLPDLARRLPAGARHLPAWAVELVLELVRRLVADTAVQPPTEAEMPNRAKALRETIDRNAATVGGHHNEDASRDQ